MTEKDPKLEKLIPVDLLPHSETTTSRPPGHDAILDLLAAPPSELMSTQRADAADVLTSAEPPALFRPGNIGIMSPDPTFPGIAPPNIPSTLRNSPQSQLPLANSGTSPFVPPSNPGTDTSPAPLLSSLPALDPALLSTQPFLPPPNESVPPTGARSTTSNPPSPSQSIPNSVRDILPLLPDAVVGPSANDAASWRQSPGAAADPSHSAAAAPSGSTSKPQQAAARDWPAVTVKLGEGHFIAKSVLLAMSHKCEEAARELCKTEIHRSFSVLRADMRANFR